LSEIRIGGVAVDASGKIYVTAGGEKIGGLTTYTAAGVQTAPTISGLLDPYGVAIH
jgi:hypothetical protein